MHVVPIGQSILERPNDRIDVILAHLSDVLEHEGQRFEDSGTDVEFRLAVLIEQMRDRGEGSSRLGNNCAERSAMGQNDAQYFRKRATH